MVEVELKIECLSDLKEALKAIEEIKRENPNVNIKVHIEVTELVIS